MIVLAIELSKEIEGMAGGAIQQILATGMSLISLMRGAAVNLEIRSMINKSISKNGDAEIMILTFVSIVHLE